MTERLNFTLLHTNGLSPVTL